MSSNSENQKAAIDFVDILFALVIGGVLDVLTRSGKLIAAGRVHLALAALLTLMSWIGYHNSSHRYSDKIRFDLRHPAGLAALGKFVVDIGLVVVYWLAVQTTEGGFSDSSQQPSWHAAALLTIVAFIGYVLWDLIAWAEPHERKGLYISWRRLTSLVCGVSVAVAGLVAWRVRPTTDHAVAVFDGVLCVIVVGYRFLKDMEPGFYERWYASRLSASSAAVSQG